MSNINIDEQDKEIQNLKKSVEIILNASKSILKDYEILKEYID